MATNLARGPSSKATTAAVSLSTTAATAPVQLGDLNLKTNALRFLAAEISEVCSATRIRTFEAYASQQHH